MRFKLGVVWSKDREEKSFSWASLEVQQTEQALPSYTFTVGHRHLYVHL